MTGPLRRAALVCLASTASLALPGCKTQPPARTACAPSQPSRLEVRDGAGTLELALKEGANAGSFDLCDAGAHRVGGLSAQASGVTLTDGAGALKLKLERASELDATGDGPKGQRLRIHVDGQETRVLKPDGIPLGAVTPRPGGATVYNPASQPIVLVEPRGNDQVLASTDGATQRYVVPAVSPTAAAAFAVEGLTLDERLALYWFWATKPSRK